MNQTLNLSKPRPKTRLTHADATKLTELGHNCVICMADFGEGEDSKMLPCMHVVSWLASPVHVLHARA